MMMQTALERPSGQKSEDPSDYGLAGVITHVHPSDPIGSIL